MQTLLRLIRSGFGGQSNEIGRDIYRASAVALFSRQAYGFVPRSFHLDYGFCAATGRVSAGPELPGRGRLSFGDPGSGASPGPEGIEEIVVTAQKREQLSKDVPIALTAISAANLQFRGIATMSDLEQQVPGLQYGFDSGNEQQIYIRGVGVDDSSASLEAPIATYVNGVYQTRTFRADSLGLDLERVEVLKGPQGTLFGRNATGGLINIVLQKPSDELTGAVKVGGGSYGQLLNGKAAPPDHLLRDFLTSA